MVCRQHVAQRRGVLLKLHDALVVDDIGVACIHPGIGPVTGDAEAGRPPQQGTRPAGADVHTLRRRVEVVGVEPHGREAVRVGDALGEQLRDVVGRQRTIAASGDPIRHGDLEVVNRQV